MSNLQKKIPFMAGVFGHLIFQTFVAYRAAEATSGNAYMKDIARSNALLIGIISLVILLLLTLLRLPVPVKVLLFTMLAYITGMTLHNIPDLQEALLEVIGIFILMFTMGVFTVQMGFKLNTFGNVLFFSLLTVLIARIINASRTPTTTRARNNKAYTKILTLIFVLFVVYDTNKILQRNYSGNFVNASLDYFVDIINLLRLTANNE